MTHPPGGSAQPLLPSLDELGRTLDKTADSRLPSAPAVKIVHLPDVVPPRAKSKLVGPAESASPWWVDGETARPQTETPQPADPGIDVEPVVIGELVEGPPTPRRSWPIDWRLVGSTVAAAVVVLGVMVYGAWATTGRTVAAKPQPQLAALQAPARPQPAPADVKLADMEKKYQEIMTRLEAQADAKPEPKPEPRPEPKPEPVSVVQEPAKPASTCYGTAVNFVGTPTEAATEAAANKKLMMVMTISGNFEESKFT
jgi:hypothetical protein